MLERKISRSWGRSWPRFSGSWQGLGVVSEHLGPHYGRLGLYFGAKVPTRRQPHHPTKKSRKPEGPKSKDGGTKLGSGAQVKQPIPKKASQKYHKTLGKTQNRRYSEKQGPAGKGDY